MPFDKKSDQKLVNKPKPLEKRLLDNPQRQKDLATFLKGIGTPQLSPFVPDDFQLKAIDLVTKVGADVLVSTPTGSGKTWIATESIKYFLSKGSRAWYTSPLKALSNDKFREFSSLFGQDNVGILTGDRKINPFAPLIVATTEIYRNSLYDAMNSLEIMNIGLVVFDEVHYLADRDRGVVWEEAIIYSPPTLRALMLSATVGNAEELADWVSWTRGTDCKLVSNTSRPVPMRSGFVDSDGHLFPLTSPTSPSSFSLNPDIASLYESKLPPASEKRRRKPSRNAFKFRNR